MHVFVEIEIPALVGERVHSPWRRLRPPVPAVASFLPLDPWESPLNVLALRSGHA